MIEPGGYERPEVVLAEVHREWIEPYLERAETLISRAMSARVAIARTDLTADEDDFAGMADRDEWMRHYEDFRERHQRAAVALDIAIEGLSPLTEEGGLNICADMGAMDLPTARLTGYFDQMQGLAAAIEDDRDDVLEAFVARLEEEIESAERLLEATGADYLRLVAELGSAER